MRVEQVFDLNTIVPEGWTTRDVYVTAYQTVAEIGDLSEKVAALNGALILLREGELTYDNSSGESEIEIVDGRIHIGIGEINFGTSKNSRWLLIVYPDPPLADEMPLKSVEGLLRVAVHEHLLYRKAFSNKLPVKGTGYGVYGPSILNPHLLGPTQLTQHALDVIEDANRKISSLPHPDRTLYIRSLRWINDAIEARDNTDSFIKAWIAIEMAFIRKDRAINVLRNVVKSAYGFSKGEEESLFSLGRIYGLRKRIVHNGESAGFDTRLRAFLIALYRDLFAWRLGGNCPRLAVALLMKEQISVRDLVQTDVTSNPPTSFGSH